MVVKRKEAVIQVLLIIFFIICCTYIGKYFYDGKKSQDNFNELKQLAKKDAAEDITDNYIPKRAENGMLETYYELYKRNNDMAGWIKIPDTQIDYPVVKAKDNEFYLRRDFDKKHQSSGIPFLDYQCTENSKNNIIYAHNMKNGSMFAALINYTDKAFYEAHKNVYFDTLYDKGRYEIVSCFTTTVGAKNEFKYYEYADIQTEEQFDEFIKKIKEISLYDIGVEVDCDDELLTLSTCAYHTSDERFVVVAKRIKY